MGDNTTNYRYNEMMYPSGQTAALELIPYLSAPLSVVGSFLIMWFIACTHARSLQSGYHRLMLGISFLDFLASMGMVVLGPWAVPKHVEFTRFGRGTFRTCAISGFFFNLTFGTMWYSGFLSTYFLLLVRFEWKDATIARTIEPVAHVMGLLYPLSTSIYGVATNAFNPMRELPGWCWFFDYPPYCSTIDGTPECQRGDHYGGVSGVGGAAAILFLMLTIIVSMVLIVIKVRKTEGQLNHYSVGPHNRSSLERTKETSWQGILYISSFVVVYLPVLLLNALEDRKSDPQRNVETIFALSLLSKFFAPLQGFFNAYIYLRKKFWKLTKEGECFAFFRHIPLIGGWVIKECDNRTSSSGSRGHRRGPNSSSGLTPHVSSTDVATTTNGDATTTIASTTEPAHNPQRLLPSEGSKRNNAELDETTPDDELDNKELKKSPAF